MSSTHDPDLVACTEAPGWACRIDGDHRAAQIPAAILCGRESHAGAAPARLRQFDEDEVQVQAARGRRATALAGDPRWSSCSGLTARRWVGTGSPGNGLAREPLAAAATELAATCRAVAAELGLEVEAGLRDADPSLVADFCGDGKLPGPDQWDPWARAELLEALGVRAAST